jgi:hypothetical protein
MIRALDRAGYWMSVRGERSGRAWLTYNPLVFLMFHRAARANAPAVMSSVRTAFPEARRYADVGSGSGAYAAEARRSGVEVFACERSPIGRFLALLQGARPLPFDLTLDPPADLPDGIDLAYCFEVAEHIPAVLGQRLIDFLATTAPVVVFTAAHPGQGGVGHINERSKNRWIADFAAAGMHFDREATDRLVELFHARGVQANWFFANAIVVRR